jgi:hypothetical protein
MALLTTTSPLAFAAAKPKVSTRKPSPAAVYRPLEIVQLAPSLPPSYRGEPPARLFNVIRPSGKGEYETTAEYAARVSKVSSTPFSVQITQARFGYDPDKRRMEVVIPASFTTSVGSNFRHYELETTFKAAGTYIGENAFGVKKRIERSFAEKYLIVDVDDEKEYGLFEDRKFGFPLEREAARASRDRLVLIALCSIDPETVAKNTDSADHFDPKIDRPLDIYLSEHSLAVHIKGFFVVDPKNGAIVTRLGFTFGSCREALLNGPGTRADDVDAACQSETKMVEPTASGGEKWTYPNLRIILSVDGGEVNAVERQGSASISNDQPGSTARN